MLHNFSFPSYISFIHIGSTGISSKSAVFATHTHIENKIGTEESGGAERAPKCICHNFVAYIHVQMFETD